ncbi:Shedu anti-phage system protein SduA domain-containing protein [Paludibacter jiangxiensis]|uniref:Shedu protein SduA C-terminal domain-containing protein n=1 Tax=Paludibacter jiangxiensis TaxID=681398 RepID=A0A161LDF5_9BACT|nr:Shedu anti-phage system protein SduA domain-containing protein [Paludibacter jiangxiensis]GAT62215.1 hypothetical protein PJIAN_1808 [Paludibacter jiangxiensis]
MLSKELQSILAETKGEGEISSFLAHNPNLIRWAVCRTGGHSTYVLKEFPFGSKYKADFVVPMSYSGAWEVNIIELEPPDDIVITKEGLPSNRLNKAISQINDWKEYIARNPLEFRMDLSNWCIKKDLLGFFNDKKTPTNNTGDLLNSPETAIFYNYYIFIGNRENVDNEKRRRVNQLRNEIEIFTYGRFLDIAKNFDKAEMNPNETIFFTRLR